MSGSVGEWVAAPSLRWLVYVPLVLVPLVIVGPMFGARLGPVDDYWIVLLDQVMDERGIAAGWTIVDTQTIGRFRPLYWVLWSTEVLIWGPQAVMWYVDRLLLAAATAFSAYWLASIWLRPAYALLAALLVLIGPQTEAFARLGPQEAFAVPMTLVGFALIGRRNFAGLALTTLAALVKEPFLLVAVTGIIWAWWLGARRSLALPAIGTLGAALGIGLSVFQEGSYRPPAFEGRYLYPFILPVALAAALVARQSRTATVLLMAWIAVALAIQTQDSLERAAYTRHFAGVLAGITGRPYVVNLVHAEGQEYAQAVRVYLGPSPSGSPCVEIAVLGEPAGLCPTAVRLP